MKTERKRMQIKKYDKILLAISVAVIIGAIILVELPYIIPGSIASVETIKPANFTGEIGNRPGDLAPDFQRQTIDDKTIRLSDFRGKAVMINFWATWCTFCLDEMPAMQRIYDEFRSQGFEILAINRAESIAKIIPYLEAFKSRNTNITYAIILDPDDSLYTRIYSAVGMPVSFFVNKDGVIVSRKFGQLSYDEIRNNAKLALGLK